MSTRPKPEAPPVTELLHAWKQGDDAAFEQVARAVHSEFLRMAGSRLSGHDPMTLARGDVVNEVWLRLMQSPKDWANRAHFFAHAALTIRAVLTDHARARVAGKRGGERVRLTLTESAFGEATMATDLLNLDQLLTQMQQQDARSAQVFELIYFTGLDRAGVGEVLGISVPTVDRELRFSRAWLASQMGRELEA